MKAKIVVAVCGAMLLSGCPLFTKSSSTTDNACIVTPPKDGGGESGAQAKIAADLTLFAAAPIKGDIEGSVTNKFNNTYQTLSDKNAACGMILQTTVCMVKTPGNESARDTLLKLYGQKC